MRKKTRCSASFLLLVLAGLVMLATIHVPVVDALQENPTGTLIADVTDLNPITFTIGSFGGSPDIADVTVSGASSGNGTYYDIDNLVGGAGNDTFVLLPGAGLRGTLDGGPGVNTLDYSAYTTGVTVNLAMETATASQEIRNIQNVIGGAGNDTLTGSSQDNVFTGGPGKDTITGGSGRNMIAETRDADFTLTNKSLTIGSENDTLSGIQAARLTGGPGDNNLNASTFSGSVVLDGTGGNDTLRGGSGDDLLIGGPGNNSLNGGGGVNTVVETCDADFTLTDTGQLTWSEGTDTLINIENVHLIGGPGDNHFNISTPAGCSISVEGGDGYDTLTLGHQGVPVSLVTGGLTISGVQSVSYETVEAVTISDDVLVSADVTLNAREYYLGSMVVSNNSVLTLASDVSATGFQGVMITTSYNLTVTEGSLISADGQGYAGDQGPGAGATSVSDSTYGGGGGYGGQGGDGDSGAPGGGTYGSATAPTDLGSGGANGGGAGGGAIRLVAGETLLLDGGIMCQGAPGGYHAGGGSGGSIYLTAGTLAGAGTISADGGDAGEGGGGGGGGRIAIYGNTGTFSVTMTASGGAGFNPGRAGTIFPAALIEATVKIDPGTLNLDTEGTWVTCYIELPQGYDVMDIDGSTVTLEGIPAYIGAEGWATAGANTSNIMDYDGDGILERMVKCPRSAVQRLLAGQSGFISLVVAGNLVDGSSFEGADVIRVVVNKG